MSFQNTIYSHLLQIAAYKYADGKKIDGKRVLVDVERGRTVKERDTKIEFELKIEISIQILIFSVRFTFFFITKRDGAHVDSVGAWEILAALPPRFGLR